MEHSSPKDMNQGAEPLGSEGRQLLIRPPSNQVEGVLQGYKYDKDKRTFFNVAGVGLTLAFMLNLINSDEPAMASAPEPVVVASTDTTEAVAEVVTPEVEMLTVEPVDLSFDTSGYANQPRNAVDSDQQLIESCVINVAPNLEAEMPQFGTPTLPGSLGEFGVSLPTSVMEADPNALTRARMFYALRFKPIIDAVAERCMIDPSYAMAIIMQETGGAEGLVNSVGDAGLAHMQPWRAQEFGLDTLDYNDGGRPRSIDRNHVARLEHETGAANRDPRELMLRDHRFNAFSNVSAMVAMQAMALRGPRLEDESFNSSEVGRRAVLRRSAQRLSDASDIEQATARYLGFTSWSNSKGRQYWRNVQAHVQGLHSEDMIAQMRDEFNRDNPNLTINGQPVAEGQAFDAYMQAMWDYHRALYAPAFESIENNPAGGVTSPQAHQALADMPRVFDYRG